MTVFLFLALVVTWVTLGSRLSTLNQRLTELERQLRALAEVYALMVYFHETEADEATLPPKARDAWMTWYESTPDTPCIAICSTSQGDAMCKGCGRSFDEVQRWTEMSPGEKRATWRRITIEGDAWRFNRYRERAIGG